MLTFDDYKAKISIIQILEDLGYKQDISKGKVSPVFKLTDGAGNKLDEIIIKNPHSVQEHYYDRNYKGGDLIQFILNSATLLQIKLLKYLSNKKLPMILPCQNFYLS